MRQRPEEGSGLAAALQNHDAARALAEELEDPGSHGPAKRPDPADELGADPVVYPDVRTRPTAMAKPSSQHAREASPRGKVEKNDRVRRREPCREHTDLHPVDHPPLAADELRVDAAPLLRRRLDLPEARAVLPVEPVDMENRQAKTPGQRVGERGLPRAPAADHRDALHRADATACLGSPQGGRRRLDRTRARGRLADPSSDSPC